jgi:hypothetical protein
MFNVDNYDISSAFISHKGIQCYTVNKHKLISHANASNNKIRRLLSVAHNTTAGPRSSALLVREPEKTENTYVRIFNDD